MFVPESAFLHHTVLKSCLQGVVVVPNMKTSIFIHIFTVLLLYLHESTQIPLLSYIEALIKR